MANHSRITAAYVRSRLDYNPQTGVFVWKAKELVGDLQLDHQPKVFNTRFAGKRAGSPNLGGYIEISFVEGGKRTRSYAHRIAWLYVHGTLPPAGIDHVDGDRANNRIANLRPATHAENSWNTGKRSWNKSGLKGVSWDKTREKWVASIFVNRRQIPLGRFDTKEEAKAAYDAAADKHHGAFVNKG